MTQFISVADFAQLAFGGAVSNISGAAERISEVLGKSSIESYSDLRKCLMGVDRQRFPSPLVARFSTDDISFSVVNGSECPIDRHDLSVCMPVVNTGNYEPHLVTCFSRLCNQGDTVFDIGANVGFHSILFSKLVGEGGRVVAFEPNSENCRLIFLGREHNGAVNIELLPFALSERMGWAYFSSHIGSNGGFISKSTLTLHGHGTVVPTFRLDDLNLASVNLIKVDVEGAEYKALSGGEASI